jgi:hypothetical protein
MLTGYATRRLLRSEVLNGYGARLRCAVVNVMLHCIRCIKLNDVNAIDAGIDAGVEHTVARTAELKLNHTRPLTSIDSLSSCCTSAPRLRWPRPKRQTIDLLGNANT